MVRKGEGCSLSAHVHAGIAHQQARLAENRPTPACAKAWGCAPARPRPPLQGPRPRNTLRPDAEDDGRRPYCASAARCGGSRCAPRRRLRASRLIHPPAPWGRRRGCDGNRPRRCIRPASLHCGALKKLIVALEEKLALLGVGQFVFHQHAAGGHARFRQTLKIQFHAHKAVVVLKAILLQRRQQPFVFGGQAA